MKLLLAVLVLLGIFLAALSVGPVLVDRHDLAEAISSYRQAPTAENRMNLESEQEITAHIRSNTRIAGAALLALNTCGLVVVYRNLRGAPKVR